MFAQTTYHYTDAAGLKWDFQLDGTGGAVLTNLDKTGPSFVSEPGTDLGGNSINWIRYTGDVLRIPDSVSDGTNTYPVRTLSPGLVSFGVIFEKVVLPASLTGTLRGFSHSPGKRFEAAPGCQLSRLRSLCIGGYSREFPNKWETALWCDFSDCPLIPTVGTTNDMPLNDQNDNFLMFVNSAWTGMGPNRRATNGGSLNVGYDRNKMNIIYGGVCEDLFVSDVECFESPRSFTATQAKYSRTFSNVAGKAVSTLYLPYPTDLPNGMRAYTLIRKGFDENGDKAFCFAPVPAGTRLEAYKPCLVQITDGASHTLPTMHNVTVPATPDIESTAVMASADSDWKFYGTTLRIKNDKAYAKKAYYLNGNKWWAVQNGVTNDYIAPFRCFISSPTGAVPAKSFLMVLDEEDNNTTGIKSLENKTNEDIKSGKYPFYSVDGKLMGNDYNALESGQIYIVNGKKFYKI